MLILNSLKIELRTKIVFSVVVMIVVVCLVGEIMRRCNVRGPSFNPCRVDFSNRRVCGYTLVFLFSVTTEQFCFHMSGV
jgi:hypothetical protein